MVNNRFNLNEEQLLPANTLNGRVLVLAGAGTGKTRVLTSRIFNLLENGIDPSNILAITFTNKAANEMKERIAKININAYKVLACTFHSLCARILRLEGLALGFDTNFSIYDEHDKEVLIKNILKNFPESEIEDSKRNNFIKSFMYEVSKLKNAGYSPEQIKDSLYIYGYSTTTVQNFFETYQQQLIKSNAMDFDDLLLNLYKLFINYPNVLEKYQEKYKYIHVDEYQDTNLIQHKIVELLGNKYKNIFLVGDEDQGIYSWRGANIANILGYKKKYPETQVFKLERNYRSNKSILNAANLIISNNTLRNKKELWTDVDEGSKVFLTKYYSDRVEASDILQQIKRKHDRGIPYKSNAILVRANSTTRLFEDQCRALGIPYKIFGGFKFYDRKEIKDIIAYLRLLINPKDNASFLRIVNYPARGIGPKAIADLNEVAYKNNEYLFSAISKCDDSLKSKFDKFVAIFNDLKSYENSSPSEITKKLLHFSGIKKLLVSSNKEEDKSALLNIQELINTMVEAEQVQKGLTLREYIEGISLLSTIDNETDNDMLTIATIHAVKGLEFQNVYIVAVENGVFPLHIDENLEEERRLMYVAITRAMKEVRISYTNLRMKFGSMQSMTESIFIDEIRSASVSDSRNYVSHQYQGESKPIVQKFATNNINASNEIAKPINKNMKFKVGQTVYHSIFGEGKIFEIKENENMLAAIFETGIKKFNLDVASRFLE